MITKNSLTAALKKYLISIIVLIVFCFLFFGGLIKKQVEADNIEKNKHVTIAKVTNTSSKRSSGGVYYTYFFANSVYTTFESTADNDRGLIGKYFELNISKKNPEYSIIQLDKEVTDKSRIEKFYATLNGLEQ
ncbi:MAG: hypothetical protein AAFQ20_16690 [Bacteroidota bacterium]